MKNPKLCGVLKDEECCEIIQKKLRQDTMDGYTLIAYEVVPISEVNGFMGQYFTLKATVASPNSPRETKTINFFTKIPPPKTSPQYEVMLDHGSFKKEVTIYTTLFPKLLSDVDKRSVPECFLGVGDDVIVLEDMAQSGYVMPDKTKPFDFEHCKVLMRTLARFHAQTFIYEAQNQKSLLDEFAHCMEETLWPNREGKARNMLDAAVKGTVSMIDLLPNISKEESKKLKEKLIAISVNHERKLMPSVKHKNVLCHGDLWANNILFKYDLDGRPTECCFIDFQLARYNPPAHDILCFLQFTTTRKLRKEHSERLFKIYHDSMTEAVEEAGLDIANILSWEDFMDSIEDLKTTCITHGVLNISIMLLDAEATNKYFLKQPELLESVLYTDRSPLVCSKFEDTPTYRARMIDTMFEFYDRVSGSESPKGLFWV